MIQDKRLVIFLMVLFVGTCPGAKGQVEADLSKFPKITDQAYDTWTSEPLTIAGRIFDYGLRMGSGYLVYDLGKNHAYSVFLTAVGVWDQGYDYPAVFRVYTDGNLRFESPKMSKGKPPYKLQVPIKESRALKLEVESESSYEYFVWGEPKVKSVVCGDADNDGQVTTKDALLALQTAVGLRPPTETQLIALDLNDDGKITLGEVIFVLRKALKLSSTLLGQSCL